MVKGKQASARQHFKKYLISEKNYYLYKYIYIYTFFLKKKGNVRELIENLISLIFNYSTITLNNIKHIFTI